MYNVSSLIYAYNGELSGVLVKFGGEGGGARQKIIMRFAWRDSGHLKKISLSAKGVRISQTVAFKFGNDDICKNLDNRALGIFPSQPLFKHRRNYKQQTSS